MIKVGFPIPLNANLQGGQTDRVIIAQVYNEMAAVIAEARLEHLANGLYLSNDVIMPDARFVIALYRVFMSTPDGPVPDPEYPSGGVDIFWRNDVAEDVRAAIIEAMPKPVKRLLAFELQTVKEPTLVAHENQTAQ